MKILKHHVCCRFLFYFRCFSDFEGDPISPLQSTNALNDINGVELLEINSSLLCFSVNTLVDWICFSLGFFVSMLLSNTGLWMFFLSLYIFCIYFAAPRGFWNLSSLTRDWDLGQGVPWTSFPCKCLWPRLCGLASFLCSGSSWCPLKNGSATC